MLLLLLYRLLLLLLSPQRVVQVFVQAAAAVQRKRLLQWLWWMMLQQLLWDATPPKMARSPHPPVSELLVLYRLMGASKTCNFAVWRCAVVLGAGGGWPASANRSTLRAPAPFVAHDSAETDRIGCLWFVEGTPNQRLKHSYPVEHGGVYLFFSAFVKCSAEWRWRPTSPTGPVPRGLVISPAAGRFQRQ